MYMCASLGVCKRTNQPSAVCVAADYFCVFSLVLAGRGR